LSAAPYERSLSVTIFLGAPCFLITFLRQFLPKQKSWQAEDWLVYQNGLEALIENLEVNNKSDRNELRFIYSIEEEKKDFLEEIDLARLYLSNFFQKTGQINDGCRLFEERL